MASSPVKGNVSENEVDQCYGAAPKRSKKPRPSSSSTASGTVAPPKNPVGGKNGRVKKETKPKGVPKAKAKAKALAKVKPEKSRSVNDDYPDVEMVTMFQDFVWQFDSRVSPKDPNFKKAIREGLPTFDSHNLNIYWSKLGCGIKSHEKGRDVGYVSFTSCWGYESWKMAIAVKAAEILVPRLNCQRKFCL